MQNAEAVARWRLSALCGGVFLGFGIMLPFFPVWLADRGLDAREIGTVLALGIGVRVVAGPLLAWLADRGVRASTILVSTQAALAGLLLGLSLLTSFSAILIVYTLVAVMLAPIVPLTDLLITRVIRHEPRLRYGHIRLWGSLAFVAGNVAGGLLIAQASVAAIMPAMAAAAIIALVGALLARAVELPEPDGKAPSITETRPPRAVAALVCVIAGTAMIHASHAALYGFSSVGWTAQGFSPDLIGALWALGVVAEVVLFAFRSTLPTGIGPALALIAVGGISAGIRWALMPLDPGPLPSAALQVLHAFSFGAAHLGSVAALSILAPPSARGRVQGLLAASTGIANAGATLIAGQAFASGGSIAYLAMLPIALGGFVLIAAASIVVRRRA